MNSRHCYERSTVLIFQPVSKQAYIHPQTYKCLPVRWCCDMEAYKKYKRPLEIGASGEIFSVVSCATSTSSICLLICTHPFQCHRTSPAVRQVARARRRRRDSQTAFEEGNNIAGSKWHTIMGLRLAHIHLAISRTFVICVSVKPFSKTWVVF